jgi:two-component system response regulator DesR
MKGVRVMDPELALAALSESSNPLTNQERKVLSASLFGASLAEIANRLYLSEGTVRNHFSTAMRDSGCAESDGSSTTVGAEGMVVRRISMSSNARFSPL